ncbi:MAG: cyclic nucleotide-binding domain-containing protein [Polyangiaceae bacterium]
MIHSPVEHALRLLISGAPDAALRWSAAALESDAASPAALVVTAHALWRVGQKRAAIDAFTAAARRAALASDAPLAIAAIAELRTVGVDVEKLIAEVAEIVCGESSLEPPWAESPAWRGSLQPVSPMLTRNALVSRATQLVYEAAGAEHPQSTTTTFLGALSPATFRELALALHAMIVPPGFHAVEEDRESLDLYVLASGEVEISRRGGRSGARPLATLESGSMFGEMSMLASLPAATSAITTQPAILLFASRDAFEAIGARRKDLRLELAAHCRRQAVANLGSACAFMSTVPARERGAFVDRMVSRVYARGERLVRAGEEPAGLHLILSGEVALVGHEDAERIVLSTLTAGDVVGEAELIFVRHADTDAIAACPTVTLFLPRDEFFALALDYPSILHGLYSAAVRRLGETGEALASGAAAVIDAEVQLEEAPRPRAPEERPCPEPYADEHLSEPTFPLVNAARVRVASSPPPAPAPSPPPAEVTSSIAPVTTASLPPPLPSPPPSAAPRPSSSSRGSLRRLSAQGAAVVAVAASVAAVLATREERPAEFSHPTSGSPAPAETSPPMSVMSVPVLTAMSAAPSMAASAAPATQTTKAFLTSSLKQRRPKVSAQPPTPRSTDEGTASAQSAALERPAPSASAAPAASTVLAANAPPAVSAAPAASTATVVHPAASGENEFGGRE